MINKETIDKIFETVRIEEVVSDFVALKKRGINLLGNCPFHNEKTPSFTVSPIKGIYKCFGCGKAGNSVNFIMEHEHYTYPEALRYLAKKYNIPIEEEEVSPEDSAEINEKESLYLISAFAQKHFTENLFDHKEGKAIGLTYFHERGFNDETIKKFQLGYSLNEWSEFTEAALKAGYQLEYLEKTGLTIVKEDGKKIDRFKGRIMFPIHNLSGRVTAFGGRVLKTDQKAAKYLNSPESEIYYKSKVLYGLFFAKKSILAEDNCLLVEGYTDVISLHQAGIENAVASSGTSLTVDQIRLISRYTKNITILYDGDAAGIKASLRGVDLILEEGLNVKVLLFPDGDDPDSYSRKVGTQELKDFIRKNATDFVVFKTNLLLKDVVNDPVKKAGLIRDIVETIAKVPDNITRATYVKQCSQLMDINENILIAELNKIRKKQSFTPESHSDKEFQGEDLLTETIPQPEKVSEFSSEHQERDVIRLLISYPDSPLRFIDESDPQNPVEQHYTLAQVIISELKGEVEFAHPLYASVFNEFASSLEAGTVLTNSYFTNHPNKEIQQLAADLLTTRDDLSEQWEIIHNISTPREEQILEKSVRSSINALKQKKVQHLIHEYQEKIKNCSEEEELLNMLMILKQLKDLEIVLAKEKGTIITR